MAGFFSAFSINPPTSNPQPCPIMLHRRKSEAFPCVFIPSHSFDGDLSCDQGILTFDDPADNTQPEYPYLVKVGGGFRAFTKKSHAKTYYSED